VSIIVNWFDVYVQKDHPDEGCDPDSGFHGDSEGPGKVFDCLERLNTGLEMIDLPPLERWEENEDEPGKFHYSRVEDHSGERITDEEWRMDKARGMFCADYSMSVSLATPIPLTAKDVREMLA
jgi:hypothetical protein